MEKINIKFPDGSVREFDKGVTPYEVAKSISNRLADDALVAKVNGSMRDLSCKLESDSDLQLFTFDSNEGKETNLV